MNLARLFRHLVTPHWWALKPFPGAVLNAIEGAIGESEKRHDAELRFVVEGPMPLGTLLADTTSRQRAVELFAQLRVWDTEHNSGVLIYVQLLDRKVEIVADRGIHARVGQAFWDAVCGRMQAAFRAGNFEGGATAAIAEITEALATHFPPGAENPNELPDAPVVL